MKGFIEANWISIILAGALIIAAVILVLGGKKKIIYRMLYTLVTEAEGSHGSGAGAEKLAEVMRRFYDMLPKAIRVFITYGTMKRWIEQALDTAKKKWAEELETSDNQ